jgi:hypothetical protein
MTIDPWVLFIVVVLAVSVSAVLLWLAEWTPGPGEIKPPERPVTPQDWRRM